MPIQVGTNKIGSIYYGTNKIGKVYFGQNLVYQSARAIYLGYAKNFTVTSAIYRNYQSLSINDFFITPPNNTQLVSVHTGCVWDGSACTSETWSNDSISFTKTWDASTGAFSCTFGGQKVYAWIIPNSSSLISQGIIKSLGTGRNFTLSTSVASDYASCTTDNFLYRTLTGLETRVSCYSYSCWNYYGFEKTYNASSGALVSSVYTNRSTFITSGTQNTTPYYIPTNMIGG